jgi:hypothetical protein
VLKGEEVGSALAERIVANLGMPGNIHNGIFTMHTPPKNGHKSGLVLL